MPAATATTLRDMLDDQQANILGQIKHLPRLAARHVLAIGEIAVARPAALRLMLHPVVGNPDARQIRARMTLLAALLAPRPTPRTALRDIRARLGAAV